MSRRLTDQVSTWVEESLDSHLLGDTATFDVTTLLDPQQGPLLIVLLWGPSLVLGEQIQVVGALPSPAEVTASQVERFVMEGLEQIRVQRSQMAAAGPGQPSGLLMPGRG